MIFGKDSGGGAGTGDIQLNCSLAVLEWPVSEQTGGSPCRRLKKEIRKKRNRKRTRTSLRPMCRLTRRRKARASRLSTRSRERPEARFGCKGRVRGSPRTRLALTSSGRAAKSRCPQSTAWLYLGAQVAVYDHVESVNKIIQLPEV